jgi:hydroxymethylbilane synthase
MSPNVPHMHSVRLGSRRSDLAMWQSRHVAGLLEASWPGLKVSIETVVTRGDQILDTPLPLIGGKGLFTAELEEALRSAAIDIAVHSLKDLPTETPEGLAVGAIPPRANPDDALISREGFTLETLPSGATVGTSSRRRAAQLLRLRPDLYIADIRGNVPTRLRKALDTNGPYDAIVLAHAGLARLGRTDAISQLLSIDAMLPAPGQGALGVQCRDDVASLTTLAPIDHAPTRAAVTAERAFLSGLGGGCALPIAAYATVDEDCLVLRGRVSAPDGSYHVDVQAQGRLDEARALGLELAQEALASGAGAILGERQ